MTINSDGREAALKGLRQYLAQLQTARRELDRNMEAVKLSIDLLGREEPILATSEERECPYQRLGATPATLRFLSDHAGKRFKASEVLCGVQEGGFETESQNPDSLISSTLDRLADNGRISRDKTNRPKTYWMEVSEESQALPEQTDRA